MISSAESQSINQLRLFAFKLRNLYFKDTTLFYELSNLVPFSVFINKRNSLDITYSNHQLLSKGKEMEDLVEKGAAYLPKISNQLLLKLAKKKAENFNLINDEDGICNYLQLLTINGKREFFYSNKLILDKDLYFNVSSFVTDMGIVGQHLNNIFEPVKNLEYKMLQYQLLTKQEKRIIKQLIKGQSHKEIAEQLFISIHTIRTHVRNIHRKMDVKSTVELIRVGIFMDLLD